jgi:hypothetical protein
LLDEDTVITAAGLDCFLLLQKLLTRRQYLFTNFILLCMAGEDFLIEESNW